MFLKRQLFAESNDVLFVFSAEKRPLKELIAADMTSGVLRALELGNVLENLEDFTAHLLGF